MIAAIEHYKQMYQDQTCPLPKKQICIHTNNRILTKQIQRHHRHSQNASKQFEQENESVSTLYKIISTQSNIKLILNEPKSTEPISIGNAEKLKFALYHALNSLKMFSQEVSLQQYTSTATVVIKQIEIPTNIANEFRFAALSPDLRQFFTTKYKWSNRIIDTIDWEVHSKSHPTPKAHIQENNNTIHSSVAANTQPPRNQIRHNHQMPMLPQS